MIMKGISVLILALTMSLMVAAAGFAHEEKESKGMGENQPNYKAVPKAVHEKAFPEGHPAVQRWDNHCYYLESEGLYFCADDKW